MSADPHYDYSVVGGGSAGCVAAARLASDSDARVLLLEAGHSHRHPLLDMPPGIFRMINGSKFMRYHHTEPQLHLDGRVHDIPQDHVLGGGSSVNAQGYIRGRPSDYDERDALLRKGAANSAGWGWHDVLGTAARILCWVANREPPAAPPANTRANSPAVRRYRASPTGRASPDASPTG